MLGDIELKTCPFCGGDADPSGVMHGDGGTSPECMRCGATANTISYWNTRTSGWISVDDKLPDEIFDFVLAYADGAMSTIGYSKERGFYEVYPIKTQLVIGDITHWMPLPKAPKTPNVE